MLLKEI